MTSGRRARQGVTVLAARKRALTVSLHGQHGATAVALPLPRSAQPRV